MVPLLERYYADFYGKDSKDFAADCKWFRMPTVNGQEVRVNVSYVSLSYEGKVLVEEMEQHLAFFERALRLVYGDNPLGKCLTVDVG